MKSDINVTPLIDVLLVLLIIFIVVVPAAPHALDASLPETSDTPGPESLVVEVRGDTLLVNSAPVLTLDELDGRLRTAFQTRGDATLFVRAAADVHYERLVAVLDVATGAGATRIGLTESGPPAERVPEG
jgi:biopolymer transport protein ExbD